MSYEYITKYNSPNFTEGRQGNKISEIVIHHWGQDGQSFDGVVNWLCRKNGDSSAHYVVEAGKVACIVNCWDTAWHAGNFNHNLKSIGIECRPEMSASDLETVCELVADIYKTYGVLPIVGHKDIVATDCPGRYYSKLSYIKNRAIEIMNGSKPVDKPSKPDKKSIDEIAKEVINGKWGNGEDREKKLKAAGYDYNAVQKRVNELMGSSKPKPKMTARQFALEVWNEGKHGTGATREAEAKKLGVDYKEAQRLINILASGGKI